MNSKVYIRELKINDILFQEGIKVKLPFGSEGIITYNETDKLDWFPYKVKITKSNGLFHQVGDIEEFKATQLELK